MVIPLIVAALVCLLATSGVWLITADKDTDGRDSTPIGLNVPTTAPVPGGTAEPGPSGGKAMPQDKPTSASPTPSATPTPSKSTTKPATSAPPSSAAPPPSSTPPPPTSAPPQPKDYAVSGKASSSRWTDTVTLTISVVNPHQSPLGPWQIDVDEGTGRVVHAWANTEYQPNQDVLAHGVMQPGTVDVTFVISYRRAPDQISYTFTFNNNVVRTAVSITRS